jgi:hypothetical protein
MIKDFNLREPRRDDEAIIILTKGMLELRFGA